MSQYIGFSTIGASIPRTTNATPGIDGGFGGTTNPINTGKKFRLVNERLVVQDFVNALNIRQGEKVGQPEYGTRLWNFVFEPNSLSNQNEIQAEVRRLAGLDPRIQLGYVNAYPNNEGILIEIEMAVTPYNNAFSFQILFNQNSQLASVQ